MRVPPGAPTRGVALHLTSSRPTFPRSHNDYQRHLPYLWLLPAFEVQKLRRWGSGQAPEEIITQITETVRRCSHVDVAARLC